MEEMEEMEEMDEEYMDEMIEIDEVMLVQELRRAKKQLTESRRIKKRESLQETELKRIIAKEVKSMFDDIDFNLSSNWVYGNNKPKASKKGHSARGQFMKGQGFK